MQTWKERGRRLRSSRSRRTRFFGAPQCDLASFDHEVALLGVPYDQGSLIPYCRVGQSQGPNAVRANPTFFYGGNPFDGPPDPGEAVRRLHLRG